MLAFSKLLAFIAAVAADVRPQHREHIAKLLTEAETEAANGQAVPIKTAPAATPAADPNHSPDPNARNGADLKSYG
jgi:hypothetical protein